MNILINLNKHINFIPVNVYFRKYAFSILTIIKNNTAVWTHKTINQVTKIFCIILAVWFNIIAMSYLVNFSQSRVTYLK